MDNLIKWYKTNENELHPVELAAGFHQKFEQIHHFGENNGRAGRETVRKPPRELSLNPYHKGMVLFETRDVYGADNVYLSP